MQTLPNLVNAVWAYYDGAGRHDMPWRKPDSDGSFDAYKIMVSEIMLQQTQVARVTPKYEAFLQRFPDAQALATAPLAEVLNLWSGLGYNRRAKFLWQAAQMVVSDFDGALPPTIPELTRLPGIGVNTAGAIAAYAFNQPVLFIETNVRTAFIHHLFADDSAVNDKALLPLLAEAMSLVQSDPQRSPRQWYWALMDYGSHLKHYEGNAAKRSAHYAKQSKFEGSRRQIRGQVLKRLSEASQTLATLSQNIPDDRLPSVLDDLAHEGIISSANGRYHLGVA